DIRNRLYEKTMSFSLKEMNDLTVPSMITRCTNDVLQVQNGLYLLLTTALPVPFLIVGGVVGVMQYQMSMVWIVALGVGLVCGLFVLLVHKALPLHQRMAVELDSLNRVTREGLSGIQILRALNREKWNGDRIRDGSLSIRKTAESSGLIEAVMQPCMYLILNLLNLLVLWMGGSAVSADNMQVGDITAFINYLYMVISGLIMGAVVGLQMPPVVIGMGRIREVLDTEPAIYDGNGADVSSLPNCDVEFENVSFRYSDEAGMVVRNISFTAKQGEMTVIVGNTGCGKTTLMQLIPRLYDATEGTIRIGGADVREMKLDELRSLIGYVPQRAFLYRGNIRSNIAFRDQATLDDEVVKAAELSQSMPFIQAKEKGFAEWISQGGSNVSGGQRQRLTIARALTGSPKILILDDSASALDLETGLKLRDAIRSIMGEITVLFVTQRLSFIRNADKIVVMQDGEIKAVGKHEELKQSCGIYQDILQSQMGA
ncbi:MAG: ABC transporter ATP-binding protein, partial [Ruminiclostridium sp.]|nr:ABC transporter ATP-binding protein [Ruminiclostridium sp.]